MCVCDRSRWSSGVNGGGSGGGGSGGGGAGGGGASGGGGTGGASGGGSSGRSSTAARDSRRQTRVIRTGRDRGSGLLGSQPQPVIPASVIPEELISQVSQPLYFTLKTNKRECVSHKEYCALAFIFLFSYFAKNKTAY